MPSDTNHLPAQELLKLADDAVVGTCQKCRRRVKMSSVTHDGGHKTCSGPVRFGPAGKAYRAARSASPVTLEEHLLIEEYRTATAQGSEGWVSAVMATADHAKVLGDEHARRLAGEGGA